MTVTLRDAATVMLVRDAGDRARPAVEVCMLRRNLASEFVAGAYVFPGGSVDPEDRGPAGRGALPGAVRRRGQRDPRAWSRVGWPSGWPRCGSASRRPGCCWPSREAARRGPACSTPPTRWTARRSPPTGSRSTRGAPGCSTSARGGPGPGRRRRALRQPLDHPRAGPPPLRHPVLRHRGAARPGGQPRRRGDHRHHLDPSGRRAGPLRGR